MQVLTTIYSVLSKLYGFTTIRITWDICVAAVVKSVGGFVIDFLCSGKLEWFIFKGLLIGALGGFFIRELKVILKKEAGVDLKKTTKNLAKYRRLRAISKAQRDRAEDQLTKNGGTPTTSID